MDTTIFESELREGEKLLWTNGSGDFKKYDSVSKRCIMIFAAITAVVILVAALLVGNPIVVAIAAVVCCIPLITLIINVSKDAKTVKSFTYGLTDQRAFVYNGEMHSRDYKDIFKVRPLTDRDGVKSLYFGFDSEITKDSLLRSLTVCSLKPGKTQLGKDFVFYALDDCDKAAELLKQFVSVDENVYYGPLPD